MCTRRQRLRSHTHSLKPKRTLTNLVLRKMSSIATKWCHNLIRKDPKNRSHQPSLTSKMPRKAKRPQLISLHGSAPNPCSQSKISSLPGADSNSKIKTWPLRKVNTKSLRCTQKSATIIALSKIMSRGPHKPCQRSWKA